MQTIFVMVKCDLGEAYRVADAAAQVDEVSESLFHVGSIRFDDEVLSRR